MLTDETERFTTVLYQYGSLYRVTMLTSFATSSGDIKLPACYREFKTLEEAEECFNEWTSL